MVILQKSMSNLDWWVTYLKSHIIWTVRTTEIFGKKHVSSVNFHQSRVFWGKTHFSRFMWKYMNSIGVVFSGVFSVVFSDRRYQTIERSRPPIS